MKKIKGIINYLGAALCIFGLITADSENIFIPIGMLAIGLAILFRTGAMKKASCYEDIQEALSTRIVCTDIATMDIKRLEGMTLEDVIMENPSFCENVKKWPRVQASLSKESVDAAFFLSEYI